MICFMSLLSFTLLTFVQVDPSPGARYLNTKKLSTDFSVQGIIFSARDAWEANDGGLPPMVSTHLYYMGKSGDPKLLKSINDIKNLVSISTSDEALQYVRLRTSPVTCYLFKEPLWLEILPFSDINDKVMFGLEDIEVSTSKQRKYVGVMGMVDQTTVGKLLGVSVALFNKKREFEISRNIVTISFGKAKSVHVYRVTERVNQYGAYKVVGQKEIDSRDLNAISWRLWARGK